MWTHAPTSPKKGNKYFNFLKKKRQQNIFKDNIFDKIFFKKKKQEILMKPTMRLRNKNFKTSNTVNNETNETTEQKQLFRQKQKKKSWPPQF